MGASVCHASLENELDKVTDRYRVEASVELDGINADSRPDDLGVTCANRACMSDNIVTAVGQIYADIFKAIAVTAGIENTVSLDTDSFARRSRAAAGESAICHNKTSYKRYKDTAKGGVFP